MRVLVHQAAAVGKKTGVGYYASSLAEAMSRHADQPEIHRYPSGWLWQARQHWSRLSQLWGNIRKRPGRTGMGRLLQPAGFVARLAFRQAVRGARFLAERQFRAAFQSGRFDLYHEPNFIPFQTDLPTVTSIHDLSVLLHPEWHPAERVALYEREFERGLRHSRHLIVGANTVRREVIRFLNVPPQKVTRVYNGVSPRFEPLPPQSTQQQLARLGLKPGYLLAVGTIEPRKNLEMLMRAYCSLPSALRERCPLLLAGGWGWRCESVAEYYHTEARHRGVRHLGYLPDDQLPVLYNGARALAYPSHYEGFGFPPLEMMACGGAVLASTAEVFHETLGGQAHLVPATDADGWRTALARVITDDDWQAELCAGGPRRARQFSWERAADQTLAVYRTVCEPRAASRKAA
jgi:alpha-1,3-rhamnosyl/mannosyltransferase